MPTVYLVMPDFNNYQGVQTDDSAFGDRFEFDGKKLEKRWKAPPSYVPRPNLKDGDFRNVYGLSGVFAIKTGVEKALKKILTQSCELLPLEVEDSDEVLICNVTHVVNCLDKVRSAHKPDLPEWITEYAFHPRRFGYSLFKIPQTSLTEVYCVEGLSDPEDEFKGIVDKIGLTGLKFKKIWSNE